MESFEKKLARVTREAIAVEPYNPKWPLWFEREKAHLTACLPRGIIRRIEHFGSTAVPGLAAKPIVDMLIEVPSLAETRVVVPPILEPRGYDYFWRPTHGDDGPPFYCWFIKRNAQGIRTHHLHMVERCFPHWERLYFRDYLIEFPKVAKQYEALKRRLAASHRGNRIAYTQAKHPFIREVTAEAKAYYQK